MEEEERSAQLTPLRGDRVLRIRRRRPRRRLRLTPDMPGIFRFFGQIATETPLIPLILILAVLWLLASWGIYLAERGVNEQINSYGYALWWSFTAMQTQGANSPGPITTPGMIIGLVWSIFSTVAFFGVIIATLYAYFMLPKRRPFRKVVGALQYNLEELEHLSIGELEVLRDTTVQIVNTRIKEIEKRPSDR